MQHFLCIILLLEDVYFIATCFGSVKPSSGNVLNTRVKKKITIFLQQSQKYELADK
jgi:hypothetical protein